MRKKIILLLICLNLVQAKVQNVELLADSVTRVGEIVNANGNVVAYSQDYFLTADRAVYDKKNEILELFGNINAIKTKTQIMRTDYLKLYLATDGSESTATFLMDQEGEIWSQSNETCSDAEYYRSKGSIVSSCNVQNPDWKISYTSGKMNKKTKFMHLYNPVFYVGKVPVLYLPYFGFPTDKTRRSGLLIPEIAYLSEQGLYYKQPIYFAPMQSWDLEFDPQIRTRRGAGVYTQFRFADSPYSYGEIKGGVFQNRQKAQERLEYKNRSHRGFEVNYDRSKLAGYLLNGDFRENLWLDFKSINDLGYFDLIEKKSSSNDSLISSKLNYYATTDEHYAGLYARYYIDTAKLNSYSKYKNRDTLQELPSLQYHKFTAHLIVPNLTYSVDTNYHNYTRKVGTYAEQYDLNLPLNLTIPLPSEYARLNLGENLYATRINYGRNYEFKDGNLLEHKKDDYVNHYHFIGISSDLAKAYESFFHTMAFNLDYIHPAFHRGDIDERIFKKYVYDDIGTSASTSRLQNIKDNLFYEDNFVGKLSKDYTQRNLSTNFTQYIFDQNGQKRLRHSAKIKYDFVDKEFGNLDNKVNLYLSNGFSIGNRISYSLKSDSLEKSQTYASYSGGVVGAKVSHNYEYVKSATSQNITYDKENYLNFGLDFKLPEYFNLFSAVEYDLQNSYTKMWRAGITNNRKCWNYTLVYQENIEPKTTSRNSVEKEKKERGLYLFVNFYPFGGVHSRVSQTDDERYK